MISGNKEVLSTLENYLEIAKKNPIVHLAISMVGPNMGIAESTGNTSFQEMTRGGLNHLIEEMDKSIDIYGLPEPDENLDAGYVCYNAVLGPHNYDFISWLIDAEMTRIEEDCEPPLKVGFWQGKGNKLKPGEQGHNWLNDVFRPALKLIGAIEDDKAFYGRHKKLYGCRDISYLSKNFLRSVPKLIPTFPWTDSGYITITLKEENEDWINFKYYLEQKGNEVILLKESSSILSRFSIYESAKCNLFYDSDLSILALFGSRPWLCFYEISNKYFVNSSMGWELLNGFPVGEQYPWCLDNQRMIWKTPNFSNLVESWEEYME